MSHAPTRRTTPPPWYVTVGTLALIALVLYLRWDSERPAAAPSLPPTSVASTTTSPSDIPTADEPADESRSVNDAPAIVVEEPFPSAPPVAPPQPKVETVAQTESPPATKPAPKKPAPTPKSNQPVTKPVAKAPPPAEKPPKTLIKNVTLKDQNNHVIYKGDIDLEPTLDRIDRGERTEHRNDGSTFRNLERRLPQKPNGYYTEYVVPTPKYDGPGPQRLVLGRDGEVYYTHDHYRSFRRIE